MGTEISILYIFIFAYSSSKITLEVATSKIHIGKRAVDLLFVLIKFFYRTAWNADAV